MVNSAPYEILAERPADVVPVAAESVRTATAWSDEWSFDSSPSRLRKAGSGADAVQAAGGVPAVAHRKQNQSTAPPIHGTSSDKEPPVGLRFAPERISRTTPGADAARLVRRHET